MSDGRYKFAETLSLVIIPLQFHAYGARTDHLKTVQVYGIEGWDTSAT